MNRFAATVGIFMLVLVGFSFADYPAVEKKSEDASKPQSPEDTPALWRQPVALALSDDDTWLYVLCQRHPSLMIVRRDDPKTKHTHHLDGAPSAMARLHDGRLVIADSPHDALTILDMRGEELLGQRTVEVGGEPRALLAQKAGSLVWVSLRSEQVVALVDIDAGAVVRKISLPFAPHCLAMDPAESTLLVADAFRATIAAIDVVGRALTTVRKFPGTNIRGLTFSPDGEHIHFMHQIISERSIIERENVRWGAFITNNVRRVERKVFFDPAVDVVARSELGFVGDFGNGAGDPGRLLMPREGLAIVCFSGVNEVGVDTGWPFRFGRIDVGRRPVDVVVEKTGEWAYVANMFDDSISIIDLVQGEAAGSISLGPLTNETPAMRGEILFHDATLSLDNWYSCQSCHTDGHTNGSNADTASDGAYGAPKNTPSLLGVAETGPWSWVGHFTRLEDQVASSIEHTMQSRRVTNGHADDLAAYLATLKPRSTQAAREPVDVVKKGREIFESNGCVECHSGAKLTTSGTFNVGLNDGLAGHSEFNPPSLRSVSRSAPYFHDGRAASLEEVVGKYQHKLTKPLGEEERMALLAYLESL